MSGLAGVFRRSGGPVDPAILSLFSGLLARRGRGAAEIWAAGQVGLVCCHGGAPPLCDANEESLTDSTGRRIVYSGTVFNAAALSREIAQIIRQPVGGSSAEILLRVYAHWGVAGFARCNGAFACAIWDAPERRLVIARDQLGIQPLVYTQSDDLVIFASEPKIVLAHPSVRKEPNEVAIAHYLTGHRYQLQDGHTFFLGIHRLRPGEALIVSADYTRIVRYWQIDPHRTDDDDTDEDFVAEVRDLMLDAVRIRLPDGNRIGAALSGGFDSSSIVCMIDKLNRSERSGSASLDTFSYNFGTQEADEVDLINLVADSVGACHHSVDVLTDDFLADLDDVMCANDGPVVEAAVLLLWKKKRLVRLHGIDILLSGLGGDEVFMGRVNYFADLARSGHLLTLLREIRGIYPYDYSTGKASSLKRILLAYIYAPLEPHWVANLRKLHIQRTYPPAWVVKDFAQRCGVAAALPRAGEPRFPTAFNQDCHDVFYFELSTVLHFQDIASSAFSIDTRFPLLDVRIVERLFALPRRWKISRGQVRILQKRAMAGILPDAILSDHLKKDFHPTLDRFLRERYREVLLPMIEARDQRSAAFVNWRAVRAVYEAFVAGRARAIPLWCAMNLELWLRREF
jgi:asparagine synthase (glutamine-hydrolysing)